MLCDYFDSRKNQYFQEAFDEVYNFLPIWSPSSQEIEEFNKIVDEELGIEDVEFNTIIKSLFTAEISIDAIRKISHNHGFKTSIDTTIAFNKLKKLYDRIENKNIINFIFFLIFEPMEYIKEIVKGIKDNNFRELKNTLKDFIQCGDFTIKQGKSPMVIDMFCNSDDIIHKLFTDEYYEIPFDKMIPTKDTIGKDYFENMIESVIRNKEESYKQSGGGNPGTNDEMLASLKVISQLKNHWHNIVASNLTAPVNKSIFNSYTNNINIDANKGLDIYLGNYSLIGGVNTGDNVNNSVYEAAKNSLVIYQDKFNALSEPNKKKLCTFLVKWRDNFNKICKNAANIITSNIQTINNSLGNGVKFSDIESSLTKKFSTTLNNNTIAKSIGQAYASIVTDFSRKQANNQLSSLQDKISWCCSFYAPIVDSISQKLSQDRNINVKYVQFANKEHSMQILPFVNFQPMNNNNNMSGGSSQPEIKTVEKVVYRDRPIDRVIYRDSQVINSSPSSSRSVTGSYIENIINEQKQFNKIFEEAYRNLIKSFVSISTSKLTIQNSKMFDCVYALKSIGIDSPKTTVYLSGLYAAKNWNTQYIASCKRVIMKLQEVDSNMFSSTISAIEKIVSICEVSAKKAQEYITNYMTASKSTSEIITNINKVVKIPCRLSQEELNSYRENLQKLLSAFTSVSNESSAYSLKQQTDSYIKNVESRSQLIREYFRFKDEQAKLGASAMFNADRLQMITQLNSQMKECLLYLNNVVDVKLTQYRQEVSDKKSFDDKMIEKFEKAMIQFKDMSNNQELNKTLDKLKDAIYFKRGSETGTEKEEKRMFNLLQLVQKFWKQSGYIDFITQLYKEFNIFQEGFNWSQFRDNISLLLALVNISVSTQYRIKSQFLKADGTPYDNLPVPLQPLYGVKPDGTNGAVSTPLDLGIFDIIDYTSIQQIATDIVGRFSANPPLNITTANSENAAVVIQAIQQAIQQSLVYSNNNGIFKAKTQLVPLLIGAGAPPVRVDVFIELSFSEKHFNFALTPKDNNDNGGEFKLANMIFDAMLLNVVDIMNKYAEIKYTGHFNLPIQVSTLIRGGDSENNYNVSISDGDKTIGGNVFDVLSVNDNNYDNIIDEAVPFYVSAFNIIIFYYMKYHNGEGPSELEKADLYFNVPKISPIYPITSKIEAYEIKSTSQLNYQLIKCGVGVFNTYWKRATGTTPAEKLSSSIDMILNEINACMVYTTKLQYDAMKLTGTLPNNFLQSLQSNISNLTDSLQKAISESMINISMNNEQQAMIYEEIMKRDYNIVKASKENEKLNTLLRILTQGDKANDSASEIYKFIDLALMPLLQTSVSYSNIFSLFNLCVSTDTEQIMENALDLSKIYIVLPADLEHNNKKMSIWECIQYVYKYYKSSDIKLQTNAAIIKQFLETSPVVEQWNIYVISNAVYDIVYNNKSYNIPDQMWFPVYPGTYPKTPTITSKSGAGVKVGDDIKLLLYQLYPFSAGNSLYDYFITALSEFANDIDHCLHLLLAYPNIHDKFIKSVSNSVHNFIDSSESVADRFNITPDIKDKMTKVKMSRDLGFIKPPPYKNAFFLPQFGGDKQILPSISVYDSGEYINNSVVNELVFLAVDGYNQNIIMNTNKNMENTIVSYSWTDWVVQKLADCDTTFACLPYKLVQLLQSQSILSRKIQPQIFEQIGKEGKQPLPYDRNGYLENVVTQNIMGRSLSQTNQMKSQDNNAMSKQWIANLIGLIPFMINKMKTYAMNIKAGVRYGDISVKSELTALSACLITFYNDLISSCPKIGFMENTAGFENNLSYHAIGEIVPYLIKRNIENMSSAEYSKFEWANKYFFSSIQELIFPEYQNFDRFAKIKEYASNVFANAIFANEFDSVKCILAKNLWSSSIIVSGVKSANRTPESKMYEYIYKAINLTGELAPDIGERFVNNCIRVLRNDRYVSGNKEERTGDKWQTNEGLTGDKDKARMFNMIDNLKQIIGGIKATAYGNVNMTIQPPGAGAPARVNNPVPAYGYIITEQGFNAVLSSNIDKDTVNNIINYFQSLDDELNNKTLNTNLIHNAVLYTKIMGLGDGEYKRAIREIINKSVPAAAPGAPPPRAPAAPMRFVYDSKLHSNIKDANMNATSYVDIDNCIMILLHFFLVLLPYSNKLANPAQVFTDYTAVGGLNGAGPLGQTQNQSLNTVDDIARLATVTNLQKAGLHLNIDNSAINMFDPNFVQNVKQLFANNDNATLPYKANLYAILKSIINDNSRNIIKDRAIKLFGLTSKNKDIINKLFKILKTDNHGDNEIIDTTCDYLLMKPTALSNAAAAEAPTGLGNIYEINRAVPNPAPINFTTVYNPIAQKFRDSIISIDKSIYSDRTGLISLLTTEQNVAIDTAANIIISLDNIYKVIDSSISNGLNRGYKNASLAGGYERTDINKAISIMLSGLIDLTSIPMGVCDDILKELDYDDSLVLAGKLLNNIGKFKVFPCINDRPFPILNHTTKFNIYELLNNVSFTRNINDFSHDMYLFTPATDPYSQVTDTITYSNAKNYISFYTKYGNSSFFNQIKPLFALFDSFTYNAGTNHIELTQNNLNTNINKIYGVNVDIKILAYYIKLLLGYDNTPQNDNVATQGNDAIAPSVLGNGQSVNRQHEMIYADNDNNTTGFTDLTRVVPKFVYRISDIAALLYTNDAIKTLIPSFSNIEQNKINTSNEFKNKLSTIIGYLSVLVDSGEVKGILNFIIKNYPQFLSDNNQYGNTITLLRSIVFAKYIQAYLYQIPDSFTNHLLNIDDIIACEGMTNILHSTLPVFGDKLSNNTTGYITPYNSNTNNPYKPAINSSLEKYIMTTPKYQPVIEFSNMEYIIREVRSKYGVYSVLNPFKELISASAILIGDGLNYEDFASLKYLPRQGTNGKQLIGTCETNARGVPRAREGAINDIINPSAAIATQVKYTFTASQDYITIGAFDSGLLRHRNNDFDKRIGTFYHVFASEMLKQLMEAMGTNYKQLTAADYKYISVECDINSPNITNANVLTKMHLGAGDIPNLKVLYDNVNSISIYAYKFCPEQTNNMFSDKLTTGSTLGHGITAFGTNINNAVLELKDNIWVNDSSPVQTTAKIISDIFNGVTDKLETTANTGFAYNVMSGGASAVDLSEGVDIGKQLLRSFIPHPEDIQGGISPAETYANIYKDVIIKNEKGEVKLNTMYKGNSIFSNVFKFSNAAQMTTDYMFALIINYYHKYTVSFNSIYNQVLFPSIIYNSSIYSTISKKYTDLFDKETAPGANNFTKFIKSFLLMIDKEPSNFFDTVANVDETATIEREQDMSYDKLSQFCKEYLDAIDARGPAPIVPADREKLGLKYIPSINDKFLRLLINKGFISFDDENNKFRKSSLLSSIKRVDIIETFMFVILLISKYMSYYNLQMETDIAYSGQIAPEPFGYKFDI